MTTKKRRNQNVTVSLERSIIRKARELAAKRSTSVSGLVAQQIERLVRTEQAYERAKKHALAVLGRGFHLGGNFKVRRVDLHER